MRAVGWSLALACIGLIASLAVALAATATYLWKPIGWGQSQTVRVLGPGGYYDVVAHHCLAASRVSTSFLRKGDDPGDRPSGQLPSWAAKAEQHRSEYWATTWAFGWPLRCLRGVDFEHGSYPKAPPRLADLLEIRRGDRYVGRTPLPELPGALYVPIGVIPLDLTTNAALYALTLGLVVLGWRHWRERSRVTEAPCPRCGYSLTGLRGLGRDVVCPECGNRFNSSPA
jgi:hypothetical protein